MGFEPEGSSGVSTNAAFFVPVPTGNAVIDSANIRGTLAKANANGGGHVEMQSGTYVGDTAQFVIPANTTVVLSETTVWQINCTAGSTVDAITVAPNSVIFCQGFGTGQIVGSASINCRTLISNANHVLQEFFHLVGISIVLTAGGTYAVAGVEMVACFVPSGIRDCVLSCNFANSGVPGLRMAGGPSNPMGPVYVENTWITSSGGDGLLITENNPSQGPCQVWLNNVTVEHPAANFHNIHFQGFGGLAGIKMSGIHTENNNASSATVACIKIDGAYSVSIRDIDILASTITNKVGIWITSAGANGHIKIQNLFNNNNINPVIQDDTNSTTVGAGGNIYEYNGPNTTGVIQGFTTFDETVTVATPTTYALIVSSDGTITSAGAVVVQPATGFLGVYNSTTGLYYGIANSLPTPSGTAGLGAYFKGVGVGGTTSSGGNPIFGVLNSAQSGSGLGSVALTITDTNIVETFNNILDGGSGTASFAGVVAHKAGTDTSNTATASSPAFVSGTALQLNTTQDVMLYISIQTVAALAVAIGPTSATADSIMPSQSYALGMQTIRVPKGWWVKITGTIADLTITAVTC